jgi:flavin-dependent dehydrogenase
MMSKLVNQTDVFVAGGGPAGLAAAIAARNKGFDVTVADPAQFPIDKACGEGLMPEGVAALEALGLPLDARLAPGDAAIFRGIRFREPGSTVQAEFPRGYGIGMRRRKLHGIMVECAAELGIKMHWGAAVRGLFEGGVENGVILDGQRVRCRWIVGADGQNSQVRHWAGLDRSRTHQRRLGFRQHFRVAPWSDHVEVHWADRCQAYVTPVAAGEVCVALISRDFSMRFDALYKLFPELQRRLGAGAPSSSVKGAVTAMRRFRSVTNGRVALIGDASGSLDAITGEGMAMAFQQALALGDALAVGDLARYEVAHRRILRLPAFMTRLTLQMDRFPWLRHRMLRLFAAEPGIFSRMLAIHTGALPDLRTQGAGSMGW